ncbi:MAG: F0F1 ATP synthase subunit epsilon [Candidatus Magasanikbacteria bacterium]|mgnify:CR=1 FL=1|jgi:F-type H+-transporting ATPase subunit epsilon|nr:F0F1 ATP synthase subunit epsilon [Candidatus Magasanikbacteria bacterium]MBT4315292.1 F0F1 ATP synthase subunit epsilon [Candidatus Magasanikbacteria bacterium]MBT4547164.1 F0F1 ATP synthase subunit epsilon [Candidatus Magasanikbacteria bacterium]MBT6819704.1 F0F1 ATP synthase subunit epsilon [Candidatus Magasanikbacteria bacterium]
MSDNILQFKIATPEKVVYEDEIKQASIPTTSGEVTILPNHIPLVSVLQAGEIKITDKDGEHVLAVAGGFLEVRDNNEIVILADNAERAEEIDLERAEEARKRAEKELEKAKTEENIDFAKLQAVIDREMNRIKVGKKYKNVK